MIVPPPLPGWCAIDGTIVHIGAGDCREFDTYLKVGAERIVLLEPDPTAAGELYRKADGAPHVGVIRLAVGGFCGEGSLHRYNVPGLSSLNPLESNSIRWPGLRTVGQVAVSVIDLRALLERIKLTSDKSHWLIVEAAGEESEILRSLGDAAEPHIFSHLSVRLLAHTATSAKRRADFIKSFELAGYRIQHLAQQDFGDDIYHAYPDAVWAEQQSTQERLRMAEVSIKRLEEQRQSEMQDFTRSRQALAAGFGVVCRTVAEQEKLIEVLNAAAEEHRRKLAEALDRLVQHDTQVSQLEKRRLGLEQKLEAMKGAVKRSEDRQDAAREELRRAELQVKLIEKVLSKQSRPSEIK